MEGRRSRGKYGRLVLATLGEGGLAAGAVTPVEAPPSRTVWDKQTGEGRSPLLLREVNPSLAPQPGETPPLPHRPDAVITQKASGMPPSSLKGQI